jgi:hypothetical protein
MKLREALTLPRVTMTPAIRTAIETAFAKRNAVFERLGVSTHEGSILEIPIELRPQYDTEIAAILDEEVCQINDLRNNLRDCE